MKRLTITLVGSVVRAATRSFVIEVPDDVNPATLDPTVIESLADEARIAWEFDAEGFVQVSDHTAEEELDSEQNKRLPVIPFNKADDSADRPN